MGYRRFLHQLPVCLAVALSTSASAVERTETVECDLPDGSAFVLQARHDWAPLAVFTRHGSRRSDQQRFTVSYRARRSTVLLPTGAELDYQDLKQGHHLDILCARLGVYDGQPGTGASLRLPGEQRFWVTARCGMGDLDEVEQQRLDAALAQCGLRRTQRQALPPERRAAHYLGRPWRDVAAGQYRQRSLFLHTRPGARAASRRGPPFPAHGAQFPQPRRERPHAIRAAMPKHLHRMKTILASALLLSLYALPGWAQDRLECVLPQGGRILMEGACEALDDNRPETCDTHYATRFLGPGGAAPVELGITSMRRTDDSGTPAQMCANFHAREGKVHAPGEDDGQYRTVAHGQLVTLKAQPHHDKAVQKQAKREAARQALSHPGYTRMAVLGDNWVVEEALTRWHWGHYADTGFYRAPLTHVSQTLSTDQGKSWSAPRITSASKLFTMGTSALDQPDAARPGAALIADRGRQRRALQAQGKQLVLRCSLPDRAAFVFVAKLPAEEDAQRQSGARLPPFVPVDSVTYVAAPGRAGIDVDPELALVMGLPTAPGAQQEQVCNSAGLANGLPYICATMLDQGGKRFTRFAYPDKIWFPDKLPRQVGAMLMRQQLTYGMTVALSRRAGVIVLEYPLVGQACAGTPPLCPVSAVLRSQSHDKGVSWTDLAFSTTSSIFAPGKPVDRQPGRTRLH